MPEAGRVITGSAGGLRLDAPRTGTRPISDRVKQALFAMLSSQPETLARPVLDLFAGSGALAIEALSRGAPRAVLVERHGRAAEVIARNLAHTGLAARARVVQRDVAAFLATGPGHVPEAPFGLVFVDPPYERTADLAAALERLGSGEGWLAPAGLVVAKHFWKSDPGPAGDLELVRRRRFGETALSMYRRVADPAAGGE